MSKNRDKEIKILEGIFGPLSTNKWKCNWLKCAHGMGLAGRERCMFGDPLAEDCPDFEDERAFLLKCKKEYLNTRRI